MALSDVVNAEGQFVASSLLNSAEQTAANKLAVAFSDALEEGGTVIAVAESFAVGMMAGEAGIAALSAGAGVVAAAEAGAAVAGAVATQAGAVALVGPAAPIVAAVFVLIDIALDIWGAHGGVGCCGESPDPNPWPYVDGKLMPPEIVGLYHDTGITIHSLTYETKAEALARAIKQAKMANNDASCGGNRTYENVVGKYPAPAKGSFQEYADAIILGAIDQGELFKCWPIAKVNWAKLLATAVQSWNATHSGPSKTLSFTLGEDKHNNLLNSDPITWALSQAVQPDGQKTISTGQTSGFTETTIPTWGGKTSKTITIKVNMGQSIISSRPIFSQKGLVSTFTAKPPAPKAPPSKLATFATSKTSTVSLAKAVLPKKAPWLDRPIKALAGATPKEAAIGAGIIGGVTWALKLFL